MTGTDAVGREWAPIEDLPSNWKDCLFDPATHAAMQAWIDRAEELRQSAAYLEFTERQHRKWAIETGIIENAYTVSPAATMTLIQHGLDAALVSHDDTGNENPIHVVRKIADHEQAIKGLYGFVSGNRELSVSYIREMHQVLMAHQRIYSAIDQFGNQVLRELRLGEWKTWANHVDLPNGERFEYCPPEHVQAEMDQLIDWHRRHMRERVPPDIEAAWLHHRFTLIHPFQDGNGRVARTLATLVLLKGRWLPLVIDRSEKASYIAAIREADHGELGALVRFFDTNQRQELREALSHAEQLQKTVVAVKERVSSIGEKLKKRQASANQEKQAAIALSQALWDSARRQIDRTRVELQNVLQGSKELGIQVYADEGASGSEKEGYHAFQIVEAARKCGYFADRQAFQAWCKLGMSHGERFELLIAFHGIGRGRIGYLGCLAVVYRKTFEEGGQPQIEDIEPLSDSPFEFAYSETAEDVMKRFDPWLQDRITEGLAIWERDL